jgi:hypothetical protein
MNKFLLALVLLASSAGATPLVNTASDVQLNDNEQNVIDFSIIPSGKKKSATHQDSVDERCKFKYTTEGLAAVQAQADAQKGDNKWLDAIGSILSATGGQEVHQNYLRNIAERDAGYDKQVSDYKELLAAERQECVD